MSQGKILFLHGASSSGKSTIAAALQSELSEPFLHYSIDHLLAAKIVPWDRIKAGEFQWNTLRPSFFAGFHRSLPALAGAGNNLIVEHIVETQEWMDRLVTLLAGFDVFFVGIYCPVEELERRELARGDRPVGDARRDFEAAFQPAEFDLVVDSTKSIADNVSHLLRAWNRRAAPSAFGRLRGGSTVLAKSV